MRSRAANTTPHFIAIKHENKNSRWFSNPHHFCRLGASRRLQYRLESAASIGEPTQPGAVEREYDCARPKTFRFKLSDLSRRERKR